MYRLRNRLGLVGFEGVSSDGRSGGLALFCQESVTVEIQEANNRWIDAYVRVSTNDPPWHITFVYGELRVENRHIMWDALHRLHAQSNLPWMLVGDFNEAMWDYEHMSETPRAPGQMLIF